MKHQKNANALIIILLIALLAAGVVILGLPLKNRQTGGGENTPPDNPPTTSIEPVNPEPTPTPTSKPTPKPTPTHISHSTVESNQPQHHPARIAIIIDDFGDGTEIEKAILNLPYPINISVLPQRTFSTETAREVLGMHKTLLLHLPMEPMIPRDSSSLTKIKPGMSQEEVAQIIESDLAQVPGAQGINNHEGSKTTADPDVMEKVMKVIQGKNLFFIDSRTTSVSVAAKTAERNGIPYAQRNIFLDNENNPDYVRGQLKELLHDAEVEGQAIGIGHPRSATLQVLREDLGNLLNQKQVKIVPITELLQNPNEN